MYNKTIDKICKDYLLKITDSQYKPFRYLVSSILAGIFIMLSSCASLTIGSIFKNNDMPDKLILSIIFSSALSLVIMSGGDLFTGSNLYSGFLLFNKDYSIKVKLGNILRFSILCWIGNLIGSWIIALLYFYSGLMGNEVLDYFISIANNKVSIPIIEMMIRGILCNICVCLAVWCCKRMNSEGGKLIMIFWCILLFMLCGFEHSVANMGIIAIGLLTKDIVFIDYLINLLFVTIGNMIGGILFVSFPYYLTRNNL